MISCCQQYQQEIDEMQIADREFREQAEEAIRTRDDRIKELNAVLQECCDGIEDANRQLQEAGIVVPSIMMLAAEHGRELLRGGTDENAIW